MRSKSPETGGRSRQPAKLARLVDNPQLIGGRLAAAPIYGQLVAELLSFGEPRQTRALDSADMNEDVVPAVLWLNEAEPLLSIEPFHFAGRHDFSLSRSGITGRSRGPCGS